MEGYRSLNSYLREEFGEKLYKLALSASVTCPNRDGTVGSRGCIFCSEKGSGDFAANCTKSASEQIDEGIARLGKKGAGLRYIAYFQSFTSTYAPLERQRELFFGAAEDERVAVVSIATRPDCLGDEVMALLAALAKIKPLWVELGLQTVNEKTAEYIRRGYPLSVFDEGVKKLKSIGASVIVHQIIGLPGEGAEDVYATAEYIGKSGADGIKLQLLHVTKDCDLYGEYLEGRVPELSLERYGELVFGCIERLPPETVVHRITGDGAKKTLVAPLWSADKKRVLNYLGGYFAAKGLSQGSKFRI